MNIITAEHKSVTLGKAYDAIRVEDDTRIACSKDSYLTNDRPWLVYRC